jgi:hypothetical protein
LHFLARIQVVVTFWMKNVSSNVPYHVKEPGNEWRFPDSLVLNVLSELRRYITWVSLEDIVRVMHEKSDISTSFRVIHDAFRFFPFFGPYREFVERCEYRDYTDLAPAIAVRSPINHCDEFVQQALAIMLYPFLLRKPGKIQIKFGHAHDPTFIDLIGHFDIKDNPDVILIIRIFPKFTSLGQLKSLINLTSHIAGKIIFILPNDETVDEFIEYLRGIRIMAKEELPSIRVGDLTQREELVRHSCVLTFHFWSSRFIPGEPLRLNNGSLTYPELMINPINWTILLETENIPEALSDPFEIVKELIHVLEIWEGNREQLLDKHWKKDNHFLTIIC